MTSPPFRLLAVLLVAVSSGCGVEMDFRTAEAETQRAHEAEQGMLLVAEVDTQLGSRLAERRAEDARVALDKIEAVLKEYPRERRAGNADDFVKLLDDNHGPILEVLQSEDLHLLGIDLVNDRGEAVERLELEMSYEDGQLVHDWDKGCLRDLRRIGIERGLRARLWCESDITPRGWGPRTPPPLAEGARPVSFGEVLTRGHLRVRMEVTSAGLEIPEG